MIHWTYRALRPCMEATVLFFWGEAEWGLTQGLRTLRHLRLTIVIISLLSIFIVCRTVVEHALAKTSDSYSYYEGKVLEEKVAQNQRKLESQASDIKEMLEMAKVQTSLVEKMQFQIEAQQKIIDAAVKLFGALVLVPVLAILWGVFKSGLRRERALLPGRRGTNAKEDRI